MRPADDRRDRVFVLGIEEFALCYLPTARRIVTRVLVEPDAQRERPRRPEAEQHAPRRPGPESPAP